MKTISIQGTSKVPTVYLDAQTGELLFSGRFVPVSGEEYYFFHPIIDWVKEYALNPAPETVITIDLEFCSSSGIRNLHIILKILNEIYLNNKSASVLWYYHEDDEDLMEKGKQFQQILKLPVKIAEREIN